MHLVSNSRGERLEARSLSEPKPKAVDDRLAVPFAVSPETKLLI